MFKMLKGNMPSYLRTLFSIRNTECNLRNNQFKLNLPKPRTNYLKWSLSYDGALLWNSLPEEIRSLTVFPHFKKALNDLLSLSISIVTPTRQSCKSVLVFFCTERFYRV